MKQLYEVYHDFPNLSALLREISWTNNLIVLSHAKTIEEKEFYLRLCIQEKYSSRELERQISSGIYERSLIGNSRITAAVKEVHPEIKNTFKDSYIFDFLNLPEPHSEKICKKA